MKKTIAALLLMPIFLLWSEVSLSLAVSDIQLNSHLNQKLSAEIQLIKVSAEELDQLNMRITQSNSEAGQYHTTSGITVTISQYPSGQHYLQINSDEVIREPIVSFSLELSWPDGRLERKYVLLIDPK